MPKLKNPLSAKQRMAVDIYFTNGFNMYKALVEAGYAPSTARSRSTDIFNLPHVKEYMEEKRKAIEAESIATQEEVLKALTVIARRQQEDIEVLPDGQKVAHQIKTSEQLRALEKLAKYFGMDKIEINQTMKVETLVYGDDEEDDDDDDDCFEI